jgi:hypothetical protein
LPRNWGGAADQAAGGQRKKLGGVAAGMASRAKSHPRREIRRSCATNDRPQGKIVTSGSEKNGGGGHWNAPPAPVLTLSLQPDGLDWLVAACGRA